VIGKILNGVRMGILSFADWLLGALSFLDGVKLGTLSFVGWVRLGILSSMRLGSDIIDKMRKKVE
jgi:hypothetical protein